MDRLSWDDSPGLAGVARGRACSGRHRVLVQCPAGRSSAEVEDSRAQQAQKIENQRAEVERELAEQHAQDEALQAYLDQMSQLMLDRKLLEAEPGDPVHTLAQARTSTVILRLDAEHNESLTVFLTNSGLALRNNPSEALLMRSEASARFLRGISLSHAKLSNADLPDADLNIATLEGADLSNGVLIFANLSSATLIGADLSNAHLYSANLRRADLSNADLSNADLSDAQGITNEELEQQAKTLEGATMPNGQKYEDWVKGKKSHKENRENE